MFTEKDLNDAKESMYLQVIASADTRQIVFYQV